MIYLNTKIQLTQLSKKDIHEIIKYQHHLTSNPINYITEMPSGRILSDEHVIAYHIEDGWIYEYIYNEKQQQLVITLDKRSNSEPIDILQFLIDHQYIADTDVFKIQNYAIKALNIEPFIHFNASLPIVYISQSDLDIEMIHQLACKLKGMAYVVYGDGDLEKQLSFETRSFALIYNQDCLKFNKTKKLSSEDFMEMVFNKIQSYMTKRVFDYPYSFTELHKYIYSKMIEDELMKDDEVRSNYKDLLHDINMRKIALCNKQKELEEEINNLKILRDIKRDILLYKDIHPLLLKSDEVELYPGEHKDLVLKLIHEELERLKGKSHYQERIDLLNTILHEKGNEEVGERRRLLAVYLDVFGENKRKLTGKDIEILRRNGFYFEKDGSHPKAFFFGDTRYEITAYSSASDSYAGNQAYRQIRGDIF